MAASALELDDLTDYPRSTRAKQTFRRRISHFTWPWFSTTLSTGAVAVVLAETPNRFHGLETIGKLFFIVDLVLFVAFTCLIGIRFYYTPAKLKASLHHPEEGLFFGAYWVSLGLIIQCIQFYGIPACGPWLVKTLEVLFWLYCAVALIVAIGQYYVFFQRERLNVADAMPAWIFPIYPILLIGTLASDIIPSQPPDAAFTMFIGATMLQGLAWAVAFMMYTIYTQRLMTSSLPPPSTRPGMYVSVGPAGYTAAAFFALSSIAPKTLPKADFPNFVLPMGDVIQVVGALSGTFIILFAFWFCGVSTIAVLDGLVSRQAGKMKFTLNWWAFVFPNAGLTSAAIEMAEVYDSKAIKGICSALTIILVILWIMVAVAHVRALWKRQILWPGRDEDKDTIGSNWSWYAA